MGDAADGGGRVGGLLEDEGAAPAPALRARAGGRREERVGTDESGLTLTKARRLGA